LTIYDLLGREVVALIDEECPAGSHAIDWKGEDQFGKRLGSGVYFYRIDAGDFHSTRRMILVR
jgi:flagellar hook assembly protein FlgD